MNYRREIDGLRAIAVLPVILYHAGVPFFGGGFVGVDVFFVISGYLITTKILTDESAGTFSFAGFYERRARRILPALFLVLFGSLALAWAWLLPDDMKSFSGSLVAVNALVSNVFFFTDTSYFAPDASLRPLLHTWSLAVEEQYYLLYPLALVAMRRWSRRTQLTILTVLTGASLAAAQWGSVTHPRYTFFMLHSRAWEILIGALAAFYLSRARNDSAEVTRSSWAETIALAGLLAIAYPVWAFDSGTPSPSLYTLVPVAGAALVVLFATPHTVVGRLLGTEILVGIGLISYSAYLWHHPLFAFARYESTNDPGPLLLSGLGLAALVLAYGSWRFVETPFRKTARFTRRQIVVYGAGSSAVLVSIGLFGYLTNGVSARFSGNEARVLAYSHYDYKTAYRAGQCFLDENQTLPFSNVCRAGGVGNSTLIWGDSHAAALSAGLRREFPDVMQYTASRCLPIAGEVITDRPDCKAINDFVMSEIDQLKPRQIFLHADWRRHQQQEPAVNIRKTIDFIRRVSPNSSITIVGGVPQWHPSLPIVLFRQHVSMDQSLYLHSSVFDEISRLDTAFESTARETGVQFFSALQAFCRRDECQPTTTLDGAWTLTTWDYGHMTEGGSAFLSRKLLDAQTAGNGK